MTILLQLISFLFFSTQIAFAEQSHVRLDSEVFDFLKNKNFDSEAVLPVLVVYQKDSIRGAQKQVVRGRAFKQQQLMDQVKILEERVFSPIQRKNNKVQTLWIANGTAAYLSVKEIRKLLFNPAVQSITFLKRKIKFAPRSVQSSIHILDTYTYGLDKIGMSELKSKHPSLNGAGVRVGILDTGIDASHPDLLGKLAVYKNFSPAKNPDPEDGFGHGTHVAGTIVGGNASGRSIGVAPGAQLVVGRIFDTDGESTIELILQAMQWMADPDGNSMTNDFPSVVNSSWSDDSPYSDRDPKDEPFCIAIESWVKLGLIPVFSAGNTGPNYGTIGTPAACPHAISIAATNEWDQSPHFSSAGPAKWKSMELLKPDFSAPGVDIYSAMGSWDYEEMSGTSMAAPHAAGAFAILKQVKPDLSVSDAQQILVDGVKDLGKTGKDWTFGSGRIDLYKSVELLKAQ